MQFKVPQHIEIEDKVFGPFTIKQFVYIIGGLGLSYLIYRLIPILLLGIVLAAPIMLFAALLAFFPKEKYGKSFADLVESAFSYISKARLYTWKRAEKKGENMEDVDVLLKSHSVEANVPKVSSKNLSELSWNLDTASGTSSVNQNNENNSV